MDSAEGERYLCYHPFGTDAGQRRLWGAVTKVAMKLNLCPIQIQNDSLLLLQICECRLLKFRSVLFEFDLPIMAWRQAGYVHLQAEVRYRRSKNLDFRCWLFQTPGTPPSHASARSSPAWSPRLRASAPPPSTTDKRTTAGGEDHDHYGLLLD